MHLAGKDSFQAKTLWVVGLLLLLWVVFVAQEALFLLFSAFILASAMSPLVEMLDRWLPRWLAVAVPFTVLILVAVLVGLPVGSAALHQLQVLISGIPAYLDQLRRWAEELEGLGKRYPVFDGLTFNHLVAQLSSQSGAVFSGFTGVTLAISKVLINLLTALIISFFLLLDREKIQNYCLKLMSVDERERADHLLNLLIRSTGAFVNGQLMFMASFATLIAFGLYWLNVPFALLFGILAGVLTIIPIIGPNIAMVPTMIFAFVGTGDPWQMLWVLLLFIGVQIVENNFVGPLIMGKAVGLHPLVIILSILFGGLLFGLIGIVLAIPLASCLKILLEAWVFRRDEAPVAA